MLKRILLGAAVLIVAGLAAFLAFAPAYVERSLNPMTMPDQFGKRSGAEFAMRIRCCDETERTQCRPETMIPCAAFARCWIRPTQS